MFLIKLRIGNFSLRAMFSIVLPKKTIFLFDKILNKISVLYNSVLDFDEYSMYLLLNMNC